MSQFYVEFNPDGNIRTFYNDEIHGENIPEEAIPITFEQWQSYTANAYLYRKNESEGDPARLKTQEELDADVIIQPPAEKTPDQIRVEELEAQIAEMNLSQIEFMTTILQTLGVE